MSEEFQNKFAEKPADLRQKKLWKFWVVVGLAAFGLIAVIIKLFLLQVVDAEKYRERAKIQHESKKELQAERGDILDRNGILVATSVQTVSVAVDPRSSENHNKLATDISKAIGYDRNNILRKIKSTDKKFVWIARGLSAEAGENLSRIKDPGLIVLKEPSRNYLFGEAFSQVIGVSNVDNVGVSGLEKSLDTLLRGRSGFIYLRRDGKGRLRPRADLPVSPPEDGATVELTLDADIQRIVAYELKRGVLKTSAKSGTAIAMDPRSGEVLAVSSYPDFDPDNLSGKPSGAMRIKAITDTYEPGSTFKLITAAAALDEGIYSTQDSVDGFAGVANFGKYVIRDDHAIGRTTFKNAFTHSSNIVFSQVAADIPDHEFYRYIRDFGFGMKYGVELPGEVSGRIRKPGDFNLAEKRYIGHGYGVAVTPLQLLSAYCCVARGGVLAKPRFVKRAVDNRGKKIFESETDEIRKVISKETSETLIDMLTAVVDSGTGKAARIEGIKIAGKTGTSQQLVGGRYSKSAYNASFVGFFPSESPKVALLVLIDRPVGNYYGGGAAAPVFAEIAKRILAIRPELGFVEEEPTDPGKSIVPDFRGMDLKTAKKIAALVGLKIDSDDFSDEDLIGVQFPSPYAEVDEGSNVKLRPYNLEEFPDIIGLDLRRALGVVRAYGAVPEVRGSGKVRRVTRSGSDDSEVERVVLICD